MKIAISAAGENIGGNIAEAFGRCPFFIIAEVKGGKMEQAEAIRNENSGQAGGAGISSAKLVAENGVEAVITGNVGPRALEVLRQFDIGVYSASGSIQKALEGLAEGNLEIIK